MENENTITILENLIDINLLTRYNNQIMTFINGAVEAAKAAVKSEIVDGAPEAFDTLTEVSDYISTHKDEYDALVALVGDKVSTANLEAAIARIVTLETKVNALVGDETATGSVANQVKAAKEYADGKVSELENGAVKANTDAIADLEDAVEKLKEGGVSVTLASEAQIDAIFSE